MGRFLAILALGLMLGIAFWGLTTGGDIYSENYAPNHAHSKAFHGFDKSNLHHGRRPDSRMVVYDGEPDGHVAIVKGYGCGRWWTTTDRNGSANTAPGRRDTNCNLYNHRTGEIVGNRVYWGEWAAHDRNN